MRLDKNQDLARSPPFLVPLSSGQLRPSSVFLLERFLSRTPAASTEYRPRNSWCLCAEAKEVAVDWECALCCEAHWRARIAITLLRMSGPRTFRHYRSARVWAAHHMLADRGARADRAVSAVALDFGFAAASTYCESGLVQDWRVFYAEVCRESANTTSTRGISQPACKQVSSSRRQAELGRSPTGADLGSIRCPNQSQRFFSWSTRERNGPRMGEVLVLL